MNKVFRNTTDEMFDFASNHTVILEHHFHLQISKHLFKVKLFNAMDGVTQQICQQCGSGTLLAVHIPRSLHSRPCHPHVAEPEIKTL